MEGGVPVAIARPFPFQETTTAPRQSAAAGDSPRRHGLDEAIQAKPPVLARIPDVTVGPRRSEPPAPNDRPTDSAVQYRFDSPHLPAVRATTRSGKSRRATRRRRPSDSGLAQLSATIRFGVKAWEFVQTYPSTLRTVAMFVLTAAAGTSMMLMMGNHPASSDAPISTPPAATSTEPTWTAKPDASATEIKQDSSGATTTFPTNIVPTNTVPTAIGPRGLVSRSPENTAAAPIGAPAPTVDLRPSSSESLPKLPADQHLNARGPGRRPTTATSYPTTPYPMAQLPGLESEPLPQVQTSDPAVARFSGDIEPLSR